MGLFPVDVGARRQVVEVAEELLHGLGDLAVAAVEVHEAAVVRVPQQAQGVARLVSDGEDARFGIQPDRIDLHGGRLDLPVRGIADRRAAADGGLREVFDSDGDANRRGAGDELELEEASCGRGPSQNPFFSIRDTSIVHGDGGGRRPPDGPPWIELIVVGVKFSQHRIVDPLRGRRPAASPAPTPAAGEESKEEKDRPFLVSHCELFP